MTNALRRVMRAAALLAPIAGLATGIPPAMSQTAANPPQRDVSTTLPFGKTQQTAELNGLPIDVFTYKPTNCAISAILLVFHGASRDAGPYRDHAIPLAQRFCLLVVAPYFDKTRFPVERYQRGGIVENGTVRPPASWTVDFVTPLAAWARHQNGTPNLPYVLIGHSAGGQFLGRVAAYAAGGALAIIIANPSTWVEPSLTIAAPYGFGNLYAPQQSEAALRRYLAVPITVLLGGIDTGSHELSMTPEARMQGANRLDRGEETFNSAKQVAEQHGWPFNWRLFVVPNVDHSAAKMFSSQVAFDALQPIIASIGRR